MPALSATASRSCSTWRWRSWPGRAWCCSTSRRAASIRPCCPGCASACARSTPRSAPPSSSSSTTWNSSCRCARGCWCWPRAASSRKARRTRCAAIRGSSRLTSVDSILAIEDLVAGYGGLTVLNGTSFQAPRGAITTIIGPNGAGKSTVFKTVFGLLPARGGRVVFEGREVTNLGPRDLLELGISYVPQGRNIFPELSVRHNLELGATAAKPGVDVAARVESAMDRFPMLRERAGAQASTLSGGQQKLLEIARCLLLDPKLMLIDEPSIGLSPVLVKEVFTILQDLRAKGMSILMVEQNAKRALEVSDFGVVLELGRARMSGEARAILADPKVGQLFLGGGLATTG